AGAGSVRGTRRRAAALRLPSGGRRALRPARRLGAAVPHDDRAHRSAPRRVRGDARGHPVLHEADEGRRRHFARSGAGRRRQRTAAARLGRGLGSAAQPAVLVLPGFSVPRPGRAGRRLLRALQGPDGRIPRVDPDHPAGARRPARGPDLVAAGREVARTGEGAEGRGLRGRGGAGRRGRLLHGVGRHEQAVPDEVARRVVLESRGAAAHPSRLRRRRRRRDHGIGRSRVRRGGSVTLTSLPPAVQSLIMGAAVLGALVGILAYVPLLERKFAAGLQSRVGPYRVGPRGLLQPIADGVKLLLKEDLMPATADRPVFTLAPVVFLIPCLLIFATIPFAPGIGVADLDNGVLIFLAVSSLELVGLFMAGWG